MHERQPNEPTEPKLVLVEADFAKETQEFANDFKYKEEGVVVETLNEENDPKNLKGRLSFLKNLSPLLIKGNPDAVDAFNRTIKQAAHEAKRKIDEHPNIKKATLAVIFTGIAYTLLREVRKGNLPPKSPKFHGKDFEG